MEFQPFNQEFESFRIQLKSYIIRITASVQDTKGIVQYTWIKASEKLQITHLQRRFLS